MNVYRNIICPFLAVLSLITVSLFWANNLLATIILILINIITLLILNKKSYFYLFLVIFFAGAIAETIAIYFGSWHYANPNLINIPIWLPFLWGQASLHIANMYDRFKK
jgi:hypothetical protein